MVLAVLAFITVVSTAMNAQVISDETKEVGTPATKPLPHTRFTVEPAQVFQQLQGGAEQRAQALRILELNPEQGLVDARLLAIQLDADPELEAVLIVNDGLLASVHVFDKDSNGWSKAGHLLSYRPSEDVATLPEIIRFGRKEIVIRTHNLGSGGGYAAQDMAIYRMHSGRLYQVFEATESVETICLSESRQITFPISGSNDLGYLIVRYDGGLPLHAPSMCAKSQPRKRSCTAYRWDSTTFSFLPDPAGTPARCRQPVPIR